VVDLMGWPDSFSTIGQSVFQPSPVEGALSRNGNILTWINHEGWLAHNLREVVSHSDGLSASQVENMQQQLESRYQVIKTLFMKNAWYSENLND